MSDYEIWNKIKILIIDEISMASASDLKLISDRLQVLKDNSSIPFAGPDVVFTGDFSQLPPIAYPIFIDYRKISSEFIIPPKVLAGSTIWFEWVTTALQLTINLRCSPAYAEFLKRFRFNTPKTSDLEAINTRLASPSNMPPPQTPVVVPTNLERIAVIKHCAQTHFLKFQNTLSNFQNWRKCGCLMILMDIQLIFSSDTHTFENEEMIKQYVRGQKEKYLGYMCGYFFFIKGSSGIITQNIDLKSGLANGTPFEMLDVVLKESSTVFPWPIDNTMYYAASVLASAVEYIVCRHKVPFFRTKQIDPSLERGLFRLKPRTIKIKNKWKTIQFSSTITSFLAYPMSCISGHKTQGKTLDSAIVGSWGRYRYGAKGWLYTVLSRVKCLNDLYVFEKLPTNIKKFKPRKDVLKESKRIERLAEKTMREIVLSMNTSSDIVL